MKLPRDMTFIVHTIKGLSESNLKLPGRKKFNNIIGWQYQRFLYKTSVLVNVNENEYLVHFYSRKTFDLRNLYPRFSCCPYKTVLQGIEF